MSENHQNDYSTPESPGMSMMAKIMGIFLDPKRTFRSLTAKPDFVVPLIIVVLASFIFTWIAWPVIQASSLELTRQNLYERGMEQEQIDKVIEQQKKFGGIWGLAGAPVSVLIITFILAGILLFAGNIVLGGDASYLQMLSVFCYASLISVISYAVRTALILAKGTIKVYTSLAVFMPADLSDTVWFKIANIFDVFVIWKIVVIAIGMGIFYKIKTQKPLLVISILYLIFTAVSITLF